MLTGEGLFGGDDVTLTRRVHRQGRARVAPAARESSSRDRVVAPSLSAEGLLHAGCVTSVMPAWRSPTSSKGRVPLGESSPSVPLVLLARLPWVAADSRGCARRCGVDVAGAAPVNERDAAVAHGQVRPQPHRPGVLHISSGGARRRRELCCLYRDHGRRRRRCSFTASTTAPSSRCAAPAAPAGRSSRRMASG